MEIHRGSARIVFLVGQYVFKFPRIHPSLIVLKSVPKLIARGKWQSIKNNWREAWDKFTGGIRQNHTESRCWKSCKAPFLVPTYIGLGIMNIQAREYGSKPSLKEMGKLIRDMKDRTTIQVLSMNPHVFRPENYLRNSFGYRILDYGDGGIETGRLLFGDYITQWHRELEEVFCANKHLQ